MHVEAEAKKAYAFRLTRRLGLDNHRLWFRWWLKIVLFEASQPNRCPRVAVTKACKQSLEVDLR